MTDAERAKLIDRLDAALSDVPTEKEPGLLNLIAGTNLLALHVLEVLESETVCSFSISDYISCKREGYTFLLQQFDSLFVLAKNDPFHFAETLHEWCIEKAAEIRNTKGGAVAFAQLASIVQKLRHTCRADELHMAFFTVCLDLILHIFSCLEPGKCRSHFSIVGVDSNDELLIASDHFANSHIAEWEMNVSHLRTGEYDITPFLRHGCEGGFGEDDRSAREAIDRFLRRRRAYDSVRAALLPYIDSCTYDIFPKDMAYTDMGQFSMMHLELDEAALQQQLSSHRKYALAANGVTVGFEDPAGVLKTLLMKEIRMDERSCLLFKLVTAAGDFSGYYYPDDGECYYAGMDFVSLRECEPENRYEIIKKLVMYFYAVSVLDDPLYTDAGFDTAFTNVFYAVHATSFSSFSRLRDAMRRSEIPQCEAMSEESRTLVWAKN